MNDIFKMEYCLINVIGKVRESNQDNFYVEGRYRFGSEQFNDITVSGELSSADNKILAVYDGMGGIACGDKASLVAAAGTREFDGIYGDTADVLYRMSLRLNDLVCAYADCNGITSMGSTLAAVRFSSEKLGFCNLGDSRIYRIDGNNIRQISVDHVLASYHSKKAPLTQFLGLPVSEMLIEPFITEEACEDGALYLLCSDGITDMLADIEIAYILNDGESCEAMCKKLVDEALKNGGRDNITAILCKIRK